MSPWTILLLSKLDAVMITVGIILVFHLVTFVVLGLGAVYEDEEKIPDFFKRHAKMLILTPLICILFFLLFLVEIQLF